MSPRELSPDVVHAKLRTIREQLAALTSMGELSSEGLGEDEIRRFAVERIFTVLVEAAVGSNSHIAAATLDRAPASYRASFADAADAGAIDDNLAGRLAQSAAMRNLLVHRYDEVDPARLAAGAAQAAEDYREYVQSVARWLKARRSP